MALQNLQRSGGAVGVRTGERLFTANLCRRRNVPSSPMCAKTHSIAVSASASAVKKEMCENMCFVGRGEGGTTHPPGEQGQGWGFGTTVLTIWIVKRRPSATFLGKAHCLQLFHNSLVDNWCCCWAAKRVRGRAAWQGEPGRETTAPNYPHLQPPVPRCPLAAQFRRVANPDR